MNTGFQYFPERLFSQPVKMTNISQSFFGMSQPQEIFYSIKDGVWNDINTWETVSGRTGKIPTINDDVYVRHNITLNAIGQNCNNLFVSGRFIFLTSAVSVNVNNLKVSGILDSSAGGVINVYGNDNFVANYLTNSLSTFNYYSSLNCPILNITYNNLGVYGGNKFLTADLNLPGGLIISGSATIMDISFFNLTVNGNTQISNFGTLRKLNGGNILFVGNFDAGLSNGSRVDFSGNPTVELRGTNNTFNSTFSLGVFNSGTSTWSFTTNNQSLTFYNSLHTFSCPISIASGITITNNNGSGKMGIAVSLEGVDGTSAFINKGFVSLLNSSYFNPMVTGSFDFTTYSTNTIGYDFNGAISLPHTTYQNLEISGTGTKSLSGNTTCNAFTNSGTFDIIAYSFTINSTTTNSGGTFLSSGAGSLLFTGFISHNSGVFNLSGNPTIEMRGGANFYGTMTSFGSGTLTFTTNNQAIDTGVSNPNFANTILISGAITITLAAAGRLMIISGSLNGDNASSKFINRYTNSMQYQNASAPMIIGILDTDTYNNVWKYNKAGVQDVLGGTYRTLEFGGSGIKTLQGNVVVDTTAGGSWSITGTATINYNGYTITTI